ncbi:MAG: hypothetical protein ACK55I_31925, partial [bacterium]
CWDMKKAGRIPWSEASLRFYRLRKPVVIAFGGSCSWLGHLAEPVALCRRRVAAGHDQSLKLTE